MKLLKKSLALLMSLLLCLGLSTFSAFAEGANETEPSDSTEPEGSVVISAETDEQEIGETEEEDGDVLVEDPSNTSGPEETELSEGDTPDQTVSDGEQPAEEQPKPVSLSVEPLKDAQILNGKAEFVVKAVCSQEDAELTYQWQKLDINGAFNGIEDAEERLLAREAAWEDMKGETKAKLAFADIEDFSAYEGLRFRCRISAEDTVIYTNEVKLLEEPIPEDDAQEPLSPAEPEQPEESEQPEQPEEPEQPEQPEELEQPEQPEQPGQAEQPEQLEQPEEPEQPEQPEQPEEPEQPEQPEQPEEPEEPEVPETTELVLSEEYALDGDMLIEEGTILRVSGNALVPEGMTLTVAGTLIMEEEATLTVAGNLILTETAVLEGDALAIGAAETGTIEGLDRFLPEPEKANWEEILTAGIFETEEPVQITEDVVVPAEGMLVIHGGELVVGPKATLTVEGLLIIDGGTLTVAEGAALKNEMFIQVEGNGALTVAGAYEQADAAALVWDASENASVVGGIDKIMIDKTIFVADAETLTASLSRDGFRTLTIQVSGSELVKELDHIPNGVIISVR